MLPLNFIIRILIVFVYLRQIHILLGRKGGIPRVLFLCSDNDMRTFLLQVIHINVNYL